MGSTKIINVLKDDSFEEIFDIFQNTAAEDVIFVLPKKAKLFSHESHFVIMGREARKLEKSVSLLSASPEINIVASKYGFEILSGKTTRSSKPIAVTASIATTDEDIYDDSADAYSRDVSVPSDETMGVSEEKDEQADMMHEIEEEELKEEKEAVETDEEPSDDDLIEVKDDEEDEKADLASADIGGNTAILATTRKMDGVISINTPGRKKNVSLPRSYEKPVSLGIHLGENRENVPERNVEKEIDQYFRPRNNPVQETIVPAPQIEPQRVQTTPVFIPSENSVSSVGVQPAVPPIPSFPVSQITPSSPVEHSETEELESVWQNEPPEQQQSGIWGDDIRTPKKSVFSGLFNKFKSIKINKLDDNKMDLRSMIPQETKKVMSKKTWVIAGIFVVILSASLLYFMPASATITVNPSTKNIQSRIKIEASAGYASVDATFNKIPGQVCDGEESISKEFTSTGEKEVAQKARGIMRVYNTYGTTPQTLIATTRFESSGGLIFRTLKTISVLGTRVENGKIIPGSIDVEVIADKPGVTYNIEAGKFGIVAFKEKGDTDRFEKFYGQTEKSMSGGASGMAKVVTEEDYNKAKNEVSQELMNKVKEKCSSTMAGLKIVNTSDVQIDKMQSTSEIDQAAEKFTITATARQKALGVREEDIFGLIVKTVDENDKLVVLPDRLELEYSAIVHNVEKDSYSFEVTYTGPSYAKIDTGTIVNGTAGKNEKDLRDYLSSFPGVASSRVYLNPKWTRNMPENREKIKVEINYQ